MMWLLLTGWLVVAMVASTVFGRVLSLSGRRHPILDSAPIAPVAAPQAPLTTI